MCVSARDANSDFDQEHEITRDLLNFMRNTNHAKQEELLADFAAKNPQFDQKLTRRVFGGIARSLVGDQEDADAGE